MRHGDSLQYGMNAPDSFPQRAESQVERTPIEAESQGERTPIEASELVIIDDVRVRFAECDPSGFLLNKSEVSPIADIFGPAHTMSNVSMRNY